MPPRSRRPWRLSLLGAPVLLAAAVAVVLVGTAWACVPQPLLVLQPRASGPSGTEVTAAGASFGEGPVEIRWNALDGELLATGAGPSFSSPVRVPSSPEGVYTVMAIQRDAGGGISGTSATVFQVTSATVERANAPGSLAPASPGVSAGKPDIHYAHSSSKWTYMALGAVAMLGILLVGGIAGAQVQSRRSRGRLEQIEA